MSFNLNQPNIDRSAPTQKQVDQIIEFLIKMQRDLNYYMNNLDLGNFTTDTAEKLNFDKLIERVEKVIEQRFKGV